LAQDLNGFSSNHLQDFNAPCGTSESMKSNFSNQNHGSRAFRNASITFYHNCKGFDTNSSQAFVQPDVNQAGFSGESSFSWDEQRHER
jgi:hypothetical protein